jgi:GMP synthase (glutamine-hydrolysing)
VASPRLLVIQHEDECPPAWFGGWIGAAGVSVTVVRGHRGDPVPVELGEYDGLMVLGGEMGAYDDHDHPWLTPTKRLVAATVTAGRPFLGICLGHQLAAVALGGQVTKNPHGHAQGLTPFVLTDAGRADPLLGGLRPGTHVVQWNADIVARPPDEAVELATSPDGTVQAARFGARAWGVQCHPEASPEVFRAWTVAKPSAQRLGPDGIDMVAAAEAIDAAEVTLRQDWEPVARTFARLVLEPTLVS